MKKKSMIIIFIMIGIILMNVPLGNVSADYEGDYPFKPTDEIIIKALNFLKNQQMNDGSIGGFAVSSWAAMAISAANHNMHDWGKLVNYLRNKTYLLNPDKATDWERQTLAIIACDENPRDFGGIDFIAKIESFYDGKQIGDNNNLYDDFFGVLSLISGGVDKDKIVIQNIINHIKMKQNSNGGWGDVDSTSVAVMALIASGEKTDSKIIKNALGFIKSTQTNNGGFQAWGSANAASTSWAVMAIVAAGQDPTSVEWEKNGYSPVDFLLSLQNVNGGFNWTENQCMNPEWMTSYVIPALLGKPYPIKIFKHSNNGNNANQEDDNNQGYDDYKSTFLNEWLGDIRIEGKIDTVWNDIVTVGESYIWAKNVDTGEIEEHYIPYPSVLGAVDEASKKGGFSYVVEYWPSWDAFLITKIADDSDWWHYWVDYNLPMIDVGKYELTDQDKGILFGYLESWEAHALRISVDKKVVKKNEKFTVSVFNETMIGVDGAIVHVGSKNYITDDNGNVTVSCTTSGVYVIFAEKEGFVRSEKTSIRVKKSVRVVKPSANAFYFMNFKLKRELKNTWVIGAIDIEVEAADGVEKVDFYINDKIVYSDEDPPFRYRLNERCFFKKMGIMVKSYTFDIMNYEMVVNNVMRMLEKIRSFSDKNEMKTPLNNILKRFFNNLKTTFFREEDMVFQEIIMINLFPNLYE
ncbi:MAG: prenyltransferase/squalene oxidase repeat-containing protein [Thermoplasmatota archaeon]